MEHYVTVFDSLFLPQGLALHDSLERCAVPYTLWVVCVDEATFAVLGRLRLERTRLLRLSDLETPELRAVKSGRSAAEYCWTLTPFSPRFVFEQDTTVQRVTYLDADLWFRTSPDPIFREFERSGKHVLITDHAYAAEHDHAARNGRYCVQFMTFTRGHGEPVRKWWEERCIEWCYARFEDGKYGDQKYLDDWPQRFGLWVHVLQHTEWARAPWNAREVPHELAVFYHFHGLRLLANGKVNLGGYPLAPGLVHDVYVPYLDVLGRAVAALRRVGFEPKPQQRSGLLLAFKRTLFMFARPRRFRTLSILEPQRAPAD